MEPEWMIMDLSGGVSEGKGRSVAQTNFSQRLCHMASREADL
jgi:hypothetical protein